MGSLRNLWFIFFVTACALFAMPFNLPVFRIFDALVIALLLRIPTSLLATRTRWAPDPQSAERCLGLTSCDSVNMMQVFPESPISLN